jgi:hypothetical protein
VPQAKILRSTGKNGHFFAVKPVRRFHGFLPAILPPHDFSLTITML